MTDGDKLLPCCSEKNDSNPLLTNKGKLKAETQREFENEVCKLQSFSIEISKFSKEQEWAATSLKSPLPAIEEAIKKIRKFSDEQKEIKKVGSQSDRLNVNNLKFKNGTYASF